MRDRALSWLMAPAPPGRLAVVRALTVGYALVWTVVRLGYWRDLARLPHSQWQPVAFADLLGPLGPTIVTVIAAVTLWAGATTLAGRPPTWSMAVFAAGFLVLTTFGASWGAILHTEQLVCLHLLILATAPDGRPHHEGAPRSAVGVRSSASAASVPHSADAGDRSAPGESRRVGLRGRGTQCCGWPLQVMATVTVLTYFVSGLAKLRFGGGFNWLDGERLLRLVAHDNLRKRLLGDPYSPFAGHLVGHPALFQVAAIATAVVELGAPLALFVRRVRIPWIVAAWCFHLGVLVVMAIFFPYPLSGIAYASMLPVERLPGLRRLAASGNRA